jgi:hypothetical protein
MALGMFQSPVLSGQEFFLVKPGVEPAVAQSLIEIEHRRLVSGRMAQEDAQLAGGVGSGLLSGMIVCQVKTQGVRAAGALECGSLLPPWCRELARGLVPGQYSVPCTASKLAWGKAVASYRTPRALRAFSCTVVRGS